MGWLTAVGGKATMTITGKRINLIIDDMGFLLTNLDISGNSIDQEHPLLFCIFIHFSDS